MRHGCYKLCPKVREQLRKAGESGQGIADIDEHEYKRTEVAAGPSRVQKFNDPLGERRSKNSIDYSSSAGSSGKIKEKRDDTSYESLRSRKAGRKEHARWDESDARSLQKGERDRGQYDKSQGSSKKAARAKATLGKTSDRRHNDEIASHSRTRKLDAVYTSGREIVTKSPGAKRKLVSNEKIQRNRRSQTERPDHRAVERGIRKKLRERSERREKKDVDVAGPSRIRRERKRDRSIESSNEEKSDEWSFNCHDNCKYACRGINEELGKMKNAGQQEAFDEYIINKTMSYFENLCNCHYACLVDQLSKDSFVTSTIASAIIFAIGVKLCSEMDGWRITF